MIILQANCNHPRWQIRTQIAEASSWLPWKRGTRPSQPSGRHAYNSCFGMDVSHGLMTDMRKHKKSKKHQQEEYPQPPQIAIVCIIGQMMRVGQPNTDECTKGCGMGHMTVRFGQPITSYIHKIWCMAVHYYCYKVSASPSTRCF